MENRIPLAKPYFDSREIDEIRGVLDTGWVSRGPKAEEFEVKISKYLGVRYAISVTNCTSALHLSLLGLNINEGDEVLVADYTFPATGHAVMYCRAKPVFVDIDVKTYNMDPNLIKGKITEKTKAIIPVHAFGQPADMDAILKVASKYGLKVIEDAACALGARYKKRYAGTIGDIGCYSFHARKGITTGEGGMVVTNDAHLAERVRTLSIFGAKVDIGKGGKTFSVPKFQEIGYNYKMSDIIAAVGVAQLDKLEAITARKQALARYWDKRLEGIRFITPPQVDSRASHIYQSYVTLLDKKVDRNKVIDRLLEKGVQTQIGTYASHIQPAYKSMDKCPHSLDVFNRALALPMYYMLKERDIDTAVYHIEKTLEELA